MTQPPSPFDSITQADEKDSLHQLTLMMTGTKMLQDEPGIVYTLAQEKAQPQDAQAIDQFMQSLEAEKRVNLARATGDQIILSPTEQSMLDNNGVNYKDVIYTQQDAATSVARQVMDASGGKVTAKMNADGTLALDAKGNIQTEAIHHSSGGGHGFFHAVGSFFGDVGSGIKSGFVDTLHGLNKAYNFAQGALSGDFAGDIQRSVGLTPVTGTDDPTLGLDMQAAGYDSSSFWSKLAFEASGKRHSDLSNLMGTYGQDKVDEALKFLDDPKGYRTQIEGDPTNYVKTADGQTVLAPDAAAKLQYLGSKQFEDLARQVNAHQATIGNGIANELGIDPIKHSTTYALTAAGANLAAGFAIDPTMLAFQAVKVAKFAQVGIDTLADADGAAAVLTRTGPWAKSVQRGWQHGIDLGEQFRQANAAGDTAKAAAITAQFRAELPGLEPIWENFTGGTHVFQGFHPTETELVDGKLMPKAVFAPSDGIRSLDDAAAFVRDQYGLLRLMNGRAATQTSLMPGALSAFGYRKIKGLTAGWMTTRSANRTDKAFQSVVTRASADPALASKLIDEGVLRRMPAEADDAVNVLDDTVLAEKAANDGQLASQARGRLEVTSSGKGQIQRNLRETGDPIKENGIGLFSPTAIAERFRLAGVRLSTLLPRNTLIDINDARSGDTVYKVAMTYLGRGQANTLRASWNTANAGERKAIIGGLIDQLGHAAGLGKTETGQEILNRAKTSQEAYSASGNEIVLDGQNLGLFEGQTRQRWMLPSFQAMQKAAHQITIGEHTFGRPFSGNLADTIMAQWKMGALFKPSTITRNVLEGWLRTILDGRAGDALKARAVATAKNKELWDRGYGTADRELFVGERGKTATLQKMLAGGGLSQEQRANAYAQLRESKRLMGTVESKPIVQHMLATESGDTKLANAIANGSMLDGEVLGRSTLTNWAAQTAPLAAIGRAYRLMTTRHMDSRTLDALMTLGPEELQLAMEGYGQQLMAAEMGFRNAAKDATDVAAAGWGPAKIRFAVHRARSRAGGSTPGEEVNWTHQALDGTLGADRYANALAQRINSMPQTARTVIAHLEDRNATPISEVVKSLEAESKNTAFGHVFFEDPVGAPHLARRAATDEEREVGKLDWANKVVEEYRYLLTGRNGKFQQDMADYIRERGAAPDADWVAGNLVNDNRPDSALAPQVMAMVPGGVQKVSEALQDIEGGAYQWLVERPLQRTTSSPVFLANYAIARKGLDPMVEKMTEQGMSREAVENLAKELSVKNAWVKTEQLIDDPGQKTQFDVIARNLFPFSRATQAMVRRWATGLWQNPVAARKMMLSYEGAVHSGLIYTNPYGEPTFTYPGSGVMNMAMRELANVPGFSNIASFPVASTMTGGVLMSVPGADNPLRMSMGPMISIPLREVYKQLLPAAWRGDAMKMDEFINGPIGTGETFTQLVPTAVRKFYVAMEGDQRNSALASSMNGALANLLAAGYLPPPNASAAQLQEFRGRLQTQVKNQLFLRAVLGLVAPAAPSTPTEGTSGSGADYAWQVDGIKQLSDEYKSILNETGGDVGRANAVFTALHPDDVVYDPKADLTNKMPASAYETARSGANAPGAYLPSTESTLNWLNTHDGFVKRYSSVAAYFLPDPAGNQPFSYAAYKAQLEFGLRIRKTPEEFLNDVYVKHAESVFYPSVQEWDKRINDAKASGDQAGANQLTAQKSQWETEFKDLNPLFKEKVDDYGAARKTALQQIGDLRDMLQNGKAPDGTGTKLQQLVTAYDNYESFIREHAGQDHSNTTARASALDMFNRWASTALTGTPLASVFDGVFRTLNTNFVKLDGSSG